MPAPRWQEYRQVVLAALDQAGPVERIVAEQDGALVGSVLLFPPAGNVYGNATSQIDWPEVRLLAVLPSARGRAWEQHVWRHVHDGHGGWGNGSRLLGLAGARMALIYVLDNNKGTIR